MEFAHLVLSFLTVAAVALGFFLTVVKRELIFAAIGVSVSVLSLALTSTF